jgi:glycerol kinase
MGGGTGGAADIVLGIDCSTTASKAVAWDRDGRVVAEGRVPLALRSPSPGWGEQHPSDWWHATVGAVRRVVERVDAGGSPPSALPTSARRSSRSEKTAPRCGTRSSGWTSDPARS